MAFFPHVNRGDVFQPTALLENNIRDAVNAFNRSGGRSLRGVAGNEIRVSVWNASGKDFSAGSAVTLGGDENKSHGAIPCFLYEGETRPWGILADTLKINEVGDCIVGGVTTVNLRGNSPLDEGILPFINENGISNAFVAIPGGCGQVLRLEENKSVVYLSQHSVYHGYFKLVLGKIKAEVSQPSGEDEPSEERKDDGIFGLKKGKFTLYPIGNCDDESEEDEEGNEDESEDEPPKSSGESGDSSDGTRVVLAVIDGSNPDAESCGFIDMGETHFSLPRTCFANFKRNCDLYVFAECTAKKAEIKLHTEYPTPQKGMFRRLLGRLIYREGAYSVIQEQHGPIIENHHMIWSGNDIASLV